MNFVNSQLFKDVQLAEVFADSKMFADAVPKLSWQSACELYQLVGPLKGDELREFVMSNFIFADQSIPSATLDSTSVKQYILDLWPHLHRNADTDLASSLMPLQFDYIVPGGRFQEIYYWDSYFTALGLEDIEEVQKILKSNLPIYALDVNSKFESKPGVKKIQELKKFKKEIFV